MNRYSVSCSTVATAATADNAVAGLWNASTAKSIFVKEIHVFKQNATGANIANVRRASARGTQTTTFTPGIEHDVDHAIAPVSAAVLDTAWSAQPTFAGTAGKGLVGAYLPASIGSGIMWVFEEPIQVKQSAGLYICTGDAVIFQASTVTFVWLE